MCLKLALISTLSEEKILNSAIPSPSSSRIAIPMKPGHAALSFSETTASRTLWNMEWPSLILMLNTLTHGLGVFSVNFLTDWSKKKANSTPSVLFHAPSNPSVLKVWVRLPLRNTDSTASTEHYRADKMSHPRPYHSKTIPLWTQQRIELEEKSRSLTLAKN